MAGGSTLWRTCRPAQPPVNRRRHASARAPRFELQFQPTPTGSALCMLHQLETSRFASDVVAAAVRGPSPPRRREFIAPRRGWMQVHPAVWVWHACARWSAGVGHTGGCAGGGRACSREERGPGVVATCRGRRSIQRVADGSFLHPRSRTVHFLLPQTPQRLRTPTDEPWHYRAAALQAPKLLAQRQARSLLLQATRQVPRGTARRRRGSADTQNCGDTRPHSPPSSPLLRRRLDPPSTLPCSSCRPACADPPA